ncbi:MAG: alpha-1,4-glucan--maltose-1-phosphate maltosyltransferase [Gemmatimonadales bacterium]|nr:alpha-1,4-glucan--maltose-1-phosphate maltosyltransferase [Gemmatimonadales bacterium]
MPRRSIRSAGSRPPPSRGHPRIVIEHITPSVDGGRFPAKRLVGDDLVVDATVVRDGHDLLAGELRYRGPGERRWCTAPMRYEVNFDRCRGTAPLNRIGRWVFTVAVWTDRFGSWRAGLAKKAAAGVIDVGSDLLEGAALVREAAARELKGAPRGARATLEAAAELLSDEQADAAARMEAALDPDLLALMARHLPPTDRTEAGTELAVEVDRPLAGAGAWYELFPRSQAPVAGRHGTFADAERALPRLAALGFDVVYLPPIHPIGRTMRKGSNNTLVARPTDPGSPWAIGNEHGGHTAVEPALGTIEDFERFVAAGAALGLEVALDYALQCSPDHPWVREHPEWFFIRPDGTIKHAENPPKKYEDIYPLNFWCDDYLALWAACRDIVRFWIARGVRIFRVDNPHTKPFAFWDWLIAEIHRDDRDVVFLAEAFTRPARMRSLAKIGFTQSYTYFTWRNSAWELRQYLTELTRTEMVEYFRPNFFANTPDILHAYLQQGGRPAFQIRLLLAATLSPLYGIYSGFELCENVPVRPGSEEPTHSEKYALVWRDWSAPGPCNLSADIALINRLRRENPALREFRNLEFHGSENEQVLFYRKHAGDNELLIAVNLDPARPQETMVHVPVAALGAGAADDPAGPGWGLGEDDWYDVEDLLNGRTYTWRGTRNYVRLDPGVQVAHVLRARPRRRTAP